MKKIVRILVIIIIILLIILVSLHFIFKPKYEKIEKWAQTVSLDDIRGMAITRGLYPPTEFTDINEKDYATVVSMINGLVENQCYRRYKDIAQSGKRTGTGLDVYIIKDKSKPLWEEGLLNGWCVTFQCYDNGLLFLLTNSEYDVGKGDSQVIFIDCPELYDFIINYSGE